MFNAKISLLGFVFFSHLLIAMNPVVMPATQEKIHLYLLADKTGYAISKEKVKYESELLRDCYYSQSKRSRLYVPGITRQEIEIFDKALDKNISSKKENSFVSYFQSLSRSEKRLLTIAAGAKGADETRKLNAQRLTVHLIKQWLPTTIWTHHIINHCPEFDELFFDFKNLILVNDIRNGKILHLPPVTYISAKLLNEKGTERPLAKRLEDGSIKYMPRVDMLDPRNFDGYMSNILFKYENKGYRCLLQSNKIDGKGHLVTSSAMQDNTDEEINLFFHSESEIKIVKSIKHNCRIGIMSLSPDDKWLATSSSSLQGRGKFILTCLDVMSQNYLSDTLLVGGNNATSTFCFDNASRILALARYGVVELVDLATKTGIVQLELGMASPREINFNRDDSRLVCCAGAGLRILVFIWDTTDFKNIKQLTCTPVDSVACYRANITFSFPQQDIVAVSTNNNTTMFFNTNTGSFLSKTKEVTRPNLRHVAASSLCSSSFMFIGMNKNEIIEDGKLSYVNMYDALSGECIKTISYEMTDMNGIGVTSDNKYLIATFNNGAAIKTELGNTGLHDTFNKMIQQTGPLSFYALLQLHRAKKEKKKKPHMSQQLLRYITEDYPPDEYSQALLKEYFSFL